MMRAARDGLPLLALLLGSAPPATLAGQPADDCAAPAFHAFDFMIGRWLGEELRIADGDTAVVSTSEVDVRPVLGGCALEETWSVSAEGRLLFDARVVRAYDAEGERWMLSYADTGGRFQVYEGRMGADGWSFYRERATDVGPVLIRIRWTPAAHGFVQVIDRSSDGGRSWAPGSVVRYRPAGGTPAVGVRRPPGGPTEEALLLFAYTTREGFDEGYHRHLEWHRRNADPLPWFGWTVTTGERIGLFVDGTAGIPLAAFDARVDPAGDAADFEVNVAPHSTPVFRRVYRRRGDLGNGRFLEDLDPPRLVRVVRIEVVPGREPEFEAAVAERGGSGAAWYELLDGGEIPAYMALVPLRGLADLEAGVGPPAGDLERVVRRAISETWTYRPDLSLMPGDE